MRPRPDGFGLALLVGRTGSVMALLVLALGVARHTHCARVRGKRRGYGTWVGGFGVGKFRVGLMELGG